MSRRTVVEATDAPKAVEEATVIIEESAELTAPQRETQVEFALRTVAKASDLFLQTKSSGKLGGPALSKAQLLYGQVCEVMDRGEYQPAITLGQKLLATILLSNTIRALDWARRNGAIADHGEGKDFSAAVSLRSKANEAMEAEVYDHRVAMNAINTFKTFVETQIEISQGETALTEYRALRKRTQQVVDGLTKLGQQPLDFEEVFNNLERFERELVKERSRQAIQGRYIR